MFGLGTTELLLIAGAGIFIFGAKRLPEVGSALGKGFKNFKKAIDGRDAGTKSKPNTSKTKS
jgi:sec-independent protein translocase protein TatA